MDQEYKVTKYTSNSEVKYALCLTAISNEHVGANIIVKDTLVGEVTIEDKTRNSVTRSKKYIIPEL